MEKMERAKEAISDIKKVTLAEIVDAAMSAYLKYSKIEKLERLLIHKLFLCLSLEQEKELRRCVKDTIEGYIKEMYEK